MTSFSQVSLSKPCVCIYSLSSYVLCAPSIQLFLTWNTVSSTDHKTPRYIVLSIPLLLRPFQSQIAYSLPYFQIPSAYFPTLMSYYVSHPNKTRDKITVFCIPVSIFLDRKLEDTPFWTERWLAGWKFPLWRLTTYTGCFTTIGHNCRRWFPRSLWWKKFI